MAIYLDGTVAKAKLSVNAGVTVRGNVPRTHEAIEEPGDEVERLLRAIDDDHLLGRGDDAPSAAQVSVYLFAQRLEAHCPPVTQRPLRHRASAAREQSTPRRVGNILG
jgi:hypothetical protein